MSTVGNGLKVELVRGNGGTECRVLCTGRLHKNEIGRVSEVNYNSIHFNYVGT